MNIEKIKQEGLYIKSVVNNIFYKISLYFSNEWKYFLGKAPDIDDQKEHILFACMHNGINPNTLNIDILLMHLFRFRRHKVSYLKCNYGLSACEFNIYGNGEDNCGIQFGLTESAHRSRCAKCNSGFDILTNSKHLGCIDLNFYSHNSQNYYNAILSQVDLLDIRNYKYKNINLGEHVYSSVCRQLLKSTFNIQDEYEKRVLIKYIISGLKYVDKLYHLFQFNKIDRVITIHGIYLAHGILVDVANVFKIKVVVYGAPYRKNTLMFSHNETYHKSLLTENKDNWVNKIISSESLLKLKDYLSQKNGGGRDYVVYNERPINDINEIELELNISFKNKEIYTAFTNVVWDAQLFYSSNAFSNIFLWLDCLVENFTSSRQKILLIRVHPAEFKSGFSSNESILNYLTNKYSSLPENIYIIDSSSKISSYALIDISRACFVYGTKLALEIACYKKRVIISGDAWARGKGFSIDIFNSSELVKILNNPSDIPDMTDFEHDLALKYAYYYFFGRMIDMPSINLNLSNINKGLFLNFRDYTLFQQKKHNSFDIIYNGVINGDNFSQF
jgi:hypothetical protein